MKRVCGDERTDRTGIHSSVRRSRNRIPLAKVPGAQKTSFHTERKVIRSAGKNFRPPVITGIFAKDSGSLQSGNSPKIVPVIKIVVAEMLGTETSG